MIRRVSPIVRLVESFQLPLELVEHVATVGEIERREIIDHGQRSYQQSTSCQLGVYMMQCKADLLEAITSD